jgi:2-dehydro-3-deoxygluconokinase
VVDVITLGETMLRFSAPPGESLESAAEFRVDIGGAESNVAIALARLGLRVGWISRLPDNSLGRRVAGQVCRHNVDTSRVIWASDERLGTYYIDLGQSPRPSNVTYDRGDSAFSHIEPDEVDWAYVCQAEWLHLSGITPALGLGPRRVVERAIHEARKSEATVSFDVNYRSKLWSPVEASRTLTPVLSQVAVIQCAIRDAMALFGTTAVGEEAAHALYDQFRPQVVVVTEGRSGAVAYDGKEYCVASIPAITIDPVGSGDAFAAGFIAGYREGGVAQGLAWGTALAALKRTYWGDIAWTNRDELQAVLDERGEDIVR